MYHATFDRAALSSSSDSLGNRLGDALATVAWGLQAAILLAGSVVVAYAIKSKLGINLLPGPSPLHGVFLLMRDAGLV